MSNPITIHGCCLYHLCWLCVLRISTFHAKTYALLCSVIFNWIPACLPEYSICDRACENCAYLHNNWNPFFVCTLKVHSCTTQKHQVLDHRWPSPLSQTAFCRCSWSTRMHFSALRGINRIAWGTKLLLMAVLAHPLDCISWCHIMNGTALLLKSEWLL